jgi:rsbT co-antagonist protein RsbR
MNAGPNSRLAEIVRRHRDDLLSEWLRVQQGAASRRADLISDLELARESREFLGCFEAALQEGDVRDIEGSEWQPVRAFLSCLSRGRAQAGFSPSQTAAFVLSLKEPLFAGLSNELGDDAVALISSILETTELIDQLVLLTIDEYQEGR